MSFERQGFAIIIVGHRSMESLLMMMHLQSSRWLSFGKNNKYFEVVYIILCRVLFVCIAIIMMSSSHRFSSVLSNLAPQRKIQMVVDARTNQFLLKIDDSPLINDCNFMCIQRDDDGPANDVANVPISNLDLFLL
jgi:hypothetical protein